MSPYFVFTLVACAWIQILADGSFRSTAAEEQVGSDVMPTAQHTTRLPNDITFSVDQIVLGINVDTFDESYDLNSETMKQTIASCMVGVLPEDIETLEVDDRYAPFLTADSTVTQDDEADKRLYDQMKPASVLPQEDKLLMRYKVHVHSDFSKEELLNQLTIATTGATFENNLQIFATENAAVDLFRLEIGMSVESAELGRQLLEISDSASLPLEASFVAFKVSWASYIIAAVFIFAICALLLLHTSFSYNTENVSFAKVDVAVMVTDIV